MEDNERFNFPYGVLKRFRDCGLLHYDCEGNIGYGRYPNSALVKLYAQLGLHRFNLLEGTNFQLSHLKRFNMRGGGASTYYITLVAYLPPSYLHQIFQVAVSEECLGILDLTCSISRPLVTETSPIQIQVPFSGRLCHQMSTIYKARLPLWPSSEIAFTDTKRFYMVKKSELQYNDWISLYLELAICTSCRKIKAPDLAKFELEIVQVAIETLGDDDVEPPRLNSKTAVVYIAYKDLAKARIGEPCDGKAIVRRVFDEAAGTLRLRGKYWSGENIALAYGKPPSKKKFAMLRRRLGIHRLWRLSNPRRHLVPYVLRPRLD